MKVLLACFFPIVLTGATTYEDTLAQVRCDNGFFGGFGAVSASCNTGITFADAAVQGVVGNAVVVSADAGIIPPVYSGPEPFGEADLGADFQVILFGASGPGLFDPCLRIVTGGIGSQIGQIGIGGRI